ncbi:MAG TPA: hypothetical protein VGO59_05170 [Verrucomicrobiae bacterium]
MNPLEKQLQSWTPRRPSPKIARRLFGPAEKLSARATRHAAAWHWLSPVAACALTMLVAVHTSNRPPGHSAQGFSATSFASFMVNAAASPSNLAMVSLSKMDENLEFNIWSCAARHVAVPARAEIPLTRQIWSIIPTNR